LNVPVDALKVDRSFTANLESSTAAVSMVRAAVAMARAMGLRVVVEGVEYPGQAEILRRLRCDEVQGYLYGKPEAEFAVMDRVLRQLPGGFPSKGIDLAGAVIPYLAGLC
jgi:EAL domain-containing protein (putative c-di-GMP-specific phosphodiesterase class I)